MKCEMEKLPIFSSFVAPNRLRHANESLRWLNFLLCVGWILLFDRCMFGGLSNRPAVSLLAHFWLANDVFLPPSPPPPRIEIVKSEDASPAKATRLAIHPFSGPAIEFTISKARERRFGSCGKKKKAQKIAFF